MPTGYYGNSRNIVISGTPVYRFFGVIDKQFQLEGPAQVGDSQRFDFELELGVYLCGGKTYGEHIKVEEADEYVFGFVLLNDWSGRLRSMFC
jgi:fumarylacetoacetase